MKIANLFVVAACACAAESVFAVIVARPTRTEGAGYVEESGTNAAYYISYCRNSNGDGLMAQRAKGSVTSFWFDDCELVRVWENCPHELRVSVGNCGEDGKVSNRTGICIQHRMFNWRMEIRPSIPGEYQYTESEDCMLGWNRFDVVSEGAGKKSPVRCYLNGRFLYETPAPFDTVLSVGTWPYTNIVAATHSFDAADFRPAPVAAIMPERSFPTVLLKNGMDVSFDVTLDPKGAAADEAELVVALMDGRGRDIDTFKATVRRAQTSQKIHFKNIPRSGIYTVETRYLAKGMPHPDRTRRRVTIQYVDPSKTDVALAPIVLTDRPWRFLRGQQLEFIESGTRPKREATAEDFAIPDSVPADWSLEESIDTLWRYGHHHIGRTYYKGWYRQSVVVPKAWKGRRVVLDIAEPCTRATAFVNGRKFATVDFPGDEIDVTEAVRIGEENDIAIHVVGDPIFGLGRLAKELIPSFRNQWGCENRGLESRVALKPVAAGAAIDYLQACPEVKPDRLTVAFNLRGLKSGTTYRLQGEASEKGIAVCTMPETSFVATNASQRVLVTADFANVRYWEIGNPWLYDLTGRLFEERKSASGSKWSVVSESFPERFGFRQLDWHGPNLRLNGRIFTHFLKLNPPARCPDLAAQAGRFNHNSYYLMYGLRNAEDFDEAGLTGDGRIMVNGGGPHATVLLALCGAGKENDPRFWAGAEKFYRRMAKLYANHPSVFAHLGILGGGLGRNGAMYNPLFENGTWYSKYPKDGVRTAAGAAAKRLLAMQHATDPTRYITAQDAGSINEIRHITEYVGWTPLQEQIEKGLWWRQVSTKPFFISEQAAPFYANWTDACWMGTGFNGTPLYQEWSAAFKGDNAWILDDFYTKTYTQLEKNLAKEREQATKELKTDAEKREVLLKKRLKLNIPLIQQAHKRSEGPMPLHCRITRERTIAQMLWNRFHGIGMISPCFTSGPASDEMCGEGCEPLTGFLSGPAGKPTHFDHVFKAGETMNRGFVALNNAWNERTLDVRWELVVNGKRLAGESRKVSVPGGTSLVEPIEARLPTVGKGTLTISFSTEGRFLRSDSCDIEVLPKEPGPALPKGIKIALVDPLLDTVKDFRRLGIPFHYTVFDEDLSGYDLVVFGRRAFECERATMPEGIDLGALVRKGVKAVILEQSEKTLRERFRFRTEYLSPRAAFSRGNFAMDDDLLKYWRGAATLTTGYEVAAHNPSPAYYSIGDAKDGGSWQYLWNDGEVHMHAIKWGNTHQVATITVIKPDTGTFRTLVDCGHAQNYAAAFEYVEGAGRVVFSQLDVTGRTEACPAADYILRRLLAHAASAPSLPSAKVGVIKADAKVEDLMAKKDRYAAFARQGGTIFVKRQKAETLKAGWLPFKVEVKPEKLRQVVIGKPSDPLFAGLGNADFYFKGELPITTVNGKVVCEVPYGKGRFVFCQIDPKDFGDIEIDHWMREPMFRCERMIRTLLTNLGQPQPRPSFLAKPYSTLLPAYELDLCGSWQVVRTSEKYSPVRADIDRAMPGDSAGWRKMSIPGVPQNVDASWRGPDGEAWIRRTFVAPEELPEGAALTLTIGNVSGEDVVFLNGRRVAVTDTETDVNSVGQMTRVYSIPGDAVRKGENTIAVRIAWNAGAALGLKGTNGGVTGAFSLAAEKPRLKSKIPEAIDLSSPSEWWGHTIESKDERWNHGRRRRFGFPGAVQTCYKDLSTRNGFYRFKRQFKINDTPDPSWKPAIIIGAVDDEDWISVNGTRVGHTGKDTNPNDYWQAPRRYDFDPKLLRQGNNEIDLVLNDLMLGASVSGPMMLVFEDPDVTKARKLADTPYSRDVGRMDDPYWHHGF